MMQKIVNIAEELRKHNNFNTLMGIIAGMNMSSVTRLKKTLEEVPLQTKESVKALEKLMTPQASFKSYRTALHKCSLPCLPYIGTYLSDLTFIEDGNPDQTSSNLINFQKREFVYNVIAEVEQFQQTPFVFPMVEPLHSFLVELPSCSDKELYELSLRYEPKDSSSKDPPKKSNSLLSAFR